MENKVERLVRITWRRSVAILYSACILLALVTLLQSLHRQEPFWWIWDHEHNMFSYGSSLVCFSAAVIAFLTYWVVRYLKQTGSRDVKWIWLWLFASAGFLYAAFDEFVSVREKLTKYFLQEHALLGLDHSDDLFSMVYFLFALIFALVFLRELGSVKKSRTLYIQGIVLLFIANLMDVLPKFLAPDWYARPVEELGELFAGSSFALSFLIYGLDRSRTALLRWLGSDDLRTGLPPDGIPAAAISSKEKMS